jgi:phytoene dehydrogenase-like protein
MLWSSWGEAWADSQRRSSWGRFGVSALLFDEAAELGGRAKTECRDGVHLNYGPHRLYEMGAAAKGLRQLGVSIDSAAWAERRACRPARPQIHAAGRTLLAADDRTPGRVGEA